VAAFLGMILSTPRRPPLPYTTLFRSQLGAFPVRILRGAWRSESLVEILPDQRVGLEQGQPADLTKLPEHVPDEVLLYLGSEALRSEEHASELQSREKCVCRLLLEKTP